MQPLVLQLEPLVPSLEPPLVQSLGQQPEQQLALEVDSALLDTALDTALDSALDSALVMVEPSFLLLQPLLLQWLQSLSTLSQWPQLLLPQLFPQLPP